MKNVSWELSWKGIVLRWFVVWCIYNVKNTYLDQVFIGIRFIGVYLKMCYFYFFFFQNCNFRHICVGWWWMADAAPDLLPTDWKVLGVLFVESCFHDQFHGINVHSEAKRLLNVIGIFCEQFFWMNKNFCFYYKCLVFIFERIWTCANCFALSSLVREKIAFLCRECCVIQQKNWRIPVAASQAWKVCINSFAPAGMFVQVG